MASAVVGTTLTSIFRGDLVNSKSFSVDLFNKGSEALNAFQVKLYADDGSEGVVWFDSGSEWTNLPSGSPMKGVSKSTDPTTLAAGESMSFMVADSDGAIAAYESVEFLASVASNTTTVDLYLGKGQ